VTPEELCEQWDGLDVDERLEALEAIATDYLVNHGYDNVDVQSADLDEGTLAETDPDVGDIVVDEEALQDMNGDEALETLYHEIWHSMDAQDGVFDRLAEDEQQTLNETDRLEGYYDDQGEMRMREGYTVPEHDDADIFGEEMSNSVCPDEDEPEPAPAPGGPPAGSESASDGFQVEIDWEHVTVTDEFTFEPDFDNAVVTTVPASDNPGGEAEYYEGGHAVPLP
jgi:hypothetical protein